MSAVERTFQAHGLDCAVLLVNKGSHRCGYVRIPDDHPWHGLGYGDPVPDAKPIPTDATIDEMMEGVGVIGTMIVASDPEAYEREMQYQVRVHGGLTYSGKLAGSGLPSGWWVGFDCAHSGDETRYAGFEEWRSAGDHWWTEAEVAEQCSSLADQIAKAAS